MSASLTIPVLIVLILAVVLIVIFPELALWLPQNMMSH